MYYIIPHAEDSLAGLLGVPSSWHDSTWFAAPTAIPPETTCKHCVPGARTWSGGCWGGTWVACKGRWCCESTADAHKQLCGFGATAAGVVKRSTVDRGLTVHGCSPMLLQRRGLRAPHTLGGALDCCHSPSLHPWVVARPLHALPYFELANPRSRDITRPSRACPARYAPWHKGRVVRRARRSRHP